VAVRGQLWPHYFADPGVAGPDYLNRLGVECAEQTSASIKEHFKRRTLAEGLPSVRMPALFVHGENDPLPVRCSSDTAALMHNATVELVPRCGHFPWLERPGAVADSLSRFPHAAKARLPRSSSARRPANLTPPSANRKMSVSRAGSGWIKRRNSHPVNGTSLPATANDAHEVDNNASPTLIDVKPIASGRIAQAATKYVDNVPMATTCCNACRTCVQTNLLAVALAGVAGFWSFLIGRFRRTQL
jgi:hypothetical protein